MTLNLALLLHHSAKAFPAACAVIDGDTRLRYAELDARARALASALRGLGIRRGEPVALLLPNAQSFPISYFGGHYAACPVVPLNVQLKAPEIEYHLRDAQAAALIVHAALLGEAAPAAARVPGCRAILVWGAADPLTPPLHDVERLLAAAAPVQDLPDTMPDDTAVILYTSGTTGKPKGAELTHFNLVHNAEYVARELTPIDQRSVVLLALPLFHSFGQSVLQNAHIAVGGCIVLQARFEPAAAFRLLAEHAVSYFAGVPTMYFALLHHPGGPHRLPSLRYCLSGGAAMPVEVMAAFDRRFAVDILEGYGLSETSPVASFNVQGRPKKAGSIGLPIRGVRFALRDAQGAPVTALDTPGEIWISGPNVMKGYWRQPAATAEAIRDGWFRTGDIATADADGYYRIVDRAKDMILRGGFNVYPRELEEVLYAHPAIAEAAVFGVPDPRLGEEVKACVALKPGVSLTPDELIAWCKERMAAYKQPRVVEILPALPKGPTGKILKRVLRGG